jgi:hypothetical protein
LQDPLLSDLALPLKIGSASQKNTPNAQCNDSTHKRDDAILRQPQSRCIPFKGYIWIGKYVDGFQARLKTAIDNSPYKNSLRKLSIAADCGEKWLSNTLKRSDLESAKSGPGFFAMTRLAEILEISLDHLAGRNLQASEFYTANQASQLARLAVEASSDNSRITAPSPQALMRTFVRSGGRIEAFKDTLVYANQYQPIKTVTDRLVLKSVGPNSLSAITMQTDSIISMQEALDCIEGSETLATTKRDHITASERGAFDVVKRLDEPMSNLPIHVRMDYISSYLRLTDAKGTPTIVNYTSLII